MKNFQFIEAISENQRRAAKEIYRKYIGKIGSIIPHVSFYIHFTAESEGEQFVGICMSYGNIGDFFAGIDLMTLIFDSYQRRWIDYDKLDAAELQEEKMFRDIILKPKLKNDEKQTN